MSFNPCLDSHIPLLSDYFLSTFYFTICAWQFLHFPLNYGQIGKVLRTSIDIIAMLEQRMDLVDFMSNIEVIVQ